MRHSEISNRAVDPFYGNGVTDGKAVLDPAAIAIASGNPVVLIGMMGKAQIGSRPAVGCRRRTGQQTDCRIGRIRFIGQEIAISQNQLRMLIATVILNISDNVGVIIGTATGDGDRITDGKTVFNPTTAGTHDGIAAGANITERELRRTVKLAELMAVDLDPDRCGFSAQNDAGVEGQNGSIGRNSCNCVITIIRN